MSGQAPGGGGSDRDRDDDPFAVRPATDADRERPVRPLAPIGWGRIEGVEPAPADLDDAQRAEADDIAAAQQEGIDPAPAEAPQAPADDILAGVAPLDPAEDADRIAPLDQADASADADTADDAPAPAPEPEIASAPFVADDLEFAGEPDPGYVPAPADLPAGAVPTGVRAPDGRPVGEVLTGELESDPDPADDATAELVLEPIAGGDDDVRLPAPAADGAGESAVVDAELVEEPTPETPAETPAADLVDLTPRVDAGLDEDAGVVDDPAAPRAPAASAARAAALAWAAGSPTEAPAPAAAPAPPLPVPADPAPDAVAVQSSVPDAANPSDAAERRAESAEPVADDGDRVDRAPVASDDEPVDAIAVLFGEVAEDEGEDEGRDRHDIESERPASDDEEGRTHVLPAVGAVGAVGAADAGAAAPAVRPDRDAPTVAVPGSPRLDATSGSASASAPVPPPHAAPPAPRAPVLDDARVPAPPASPPRGATGPRGPRRTGLWVGGAILLVLLLIGLFYLGQRLGSAAAPDAAPVATATAAAEETPTPSPTPTDPVQGPAAAGVQAWDALLGGECIDPYTSPWEEEFTVVDCGSEHHAQMVARVALPQTGDTFPGEDAVRDSADELCIADTVIDYRAARAYTDVQYQSAYPITQDEWTAGDRDAYCFVSRAGGTFTGSIGVPQPPIVP